MQGLRTMEATGAPERQGEVNCTPPLSERASERASERGRWREGGRGGKERKREREGWMDGGMEGGTGLQNVEPHYALSNSLWAAPCQPRPIP